MCDVTTRDIVCKYNLPKTTVFFFQTLQYVQNNAVTFSPCLKEKTH